MKGKIIGLSGKIGSGKTNAAKAISNLTGGLFEIKGFAKALKKCASIMLGVDEDYMYDQKYKNILVLDDGTTLGEFLQKFGTEVGRALYSDIWVDALLHSMDDDGNYVIDDVRFKNEADALSDRGAILIRVNGDPAGVRANSKRDPNHPSETDLDDYEKFDYVLNTDGMSYAETENNIRNILEKIDPSMISKDKHRDYKVLSHSFGEFFNDFIPTVIDKDTHLGTPIGELLVRYMQHKNKVEGDMLCYDLRTGSPRDIDLVFRGDKLSEIDFQLADQNHRK